MNEAFYLIDQLIAQGVTRICIAPGARPAPFISVAARHPLAKTIVHYDERGLAFYALGYGKGSKTPAAIIVTSGSALGNLLPAVMEAHHSYTPLILITADRPAELRSCGANQTTTQTNLFAPFVRFQEDLPPTLSETYFRSIAAQAFFHATQNPPGPVHLNCQVRDLSTRPQVLSPGKPIFFPSSTIQSTPVATKASRGIIAIGELPSSPRPILDLAKRLGWPVLADLLSNARIDSTPEQIRNFDGILTTRPDLKPDFLLHFGARLTSKKILDLKPNLHVSPYPFLQDPTRSLDGKVRSDIEPFCNTFTAGPPNPNWLKAWKEEELKISMEAQFAKTKEATEIQAMIDLAEKVPEDTALFFANSLAIRHAERYFFPKACQGYFGSRGLSGIDGNIATAAGIADGCKKPLIAWVGDQTALHDLNSLPLLKKTSYPVTLIISNNFCGEIFSSLPFANWPETEKFIKAPHSLRFQKAAEMFDLPYVSLSEVSFSQSAIVELTTLREEKEPVIASTEKGL
ncbi:MAG TPA: 2-succinyl-5-enolpyruvyl-6-hydroxy-3-cyclohexene-1-carboxylic-acid synthase [Chlamydiales bacterium]|nr:2-succinyl-5-enolpyruvyl-6-hydroxy-3-cyclohexene-1-carboxylic-acid synthase [Chlamydiales bacterium]